MSHELLKPKNDVVFKHLMRDKRLLVSFLQSALDLPPEDYDKVEIVDPYLLGERPRAKSGILDVKVTTAQGNIIDIEIQLNPVPNMRERAIFYLSNRVTEQVNRGEDYRKIKRVICILITDYEEIHDSVRYHNRYRLCDLDSGSVFSKILEVNTLELPKLPKGGDMTKLCVWLEFIQATKEEEFEMLAQRDPDIGLAVVNLKTLSQDERLRELAISREKLAWDMASREEGAEQRGREEAQRAIARNLLKLGMSLVGIAQATGLSQADLLQLQSEDQTRH